MPASSSMCAGGSHVCLQLDQNPCAHPEHAQRFEQVERLADFGGRHDAIQLKRADRVRPQIARQHVEVGAALAGGEMVAAGAGVVDMHAYDLLAVAPQKLLVLEEPEI